MIERRFTLIDVMRGVKKHKLADRLSDGVYKFLIELILEANELGFKNPIDLTVKQALAIGGGESRQTLYNRRRSLSKILIDGKHLVKVKVGSYGQRSLATYDIGYELLCSYNGVWSKESQSSSNEFDDPLTSPLRSFDVPLDDPLPILRSDQKREEKTTTEVVVDDLPEKESETERRLKLVSGIKNAICDAFPDQFKGKPTDLSIRKALDEFKGDDKPILTACRVILEKEFVLDYPSPSNALKYVVATAKGDGGAVNYGYDKTYSDDPEVDSLERYLRKCVGFRNKEDQIYPCLVELAEKLKQPIEKVYAEREFLPLGMLETYKEFADT
jgi:hypothetical protein